MRIIFRTIALALLIAAFGCRTKPPSSTPQENPILQNSRTTNSWTPQADPILQNDPIHLAIEDREHHSKTEWMGCHGFAPYLPGVPSDVEWEYFDPNIHWIKGTGDDCPISEEYNQRAEDFAKLYNEKRLALKK